MVGIVSINRGLCKLNMKRFFTMFSGLNCDYLHTYLKWQ